jgi:hypothetical protein
MNIWRTAAAVAIALGLASCGGSGGGADAVCADFRYQEDAQSAFRGGADQLDRDNDGIACEDLPRRPAGSSSAPTPTTPSVSYTPYNAVLAAGATVKLRPAFGGYAYEEHTFEGGAMHSGPLTPTSAGGGSQVAASGLSLRYFATSDAGLVTWSPNTSGYSASTGLGVDASTAVSLADVAGTYRLIGQKCHPATRTCSLAYGSAAVTATGSLRVCMASEFSDTCAAGDTRMLSRTSDSSATLWSLGDPKQSLIALRAKSAIAFTYQDNRVGSNGTTDPSGYTFYGLKSTVTAPAQLPASSMTGFDTSGQLLTGSPLEAQWIVVANKPLTGFQQDSQGNTYLASTTGVMVSWSASRGLRHYLSR